METKKIEVCDAIMYDVTCAENDWGDIKIGGPATLGYEFYVSPDQDIDETTRFIKKCIKKYKRPFMSIHTGVRKDFPVESLWTRERMEECIQKYEM